MAAVAPFAVEPKMGLNDEDEDMDKQLVALRLAALSTMKAKKAKAMASEPKTTPGRFTKDRCRIRNNAVFKRIPNSNLISIVPISPCDELDQPKPTSRFTSEVYHQQPNRNNQQEIKSPFPNLVLPQHRYCKTTVNIPKQEKKRVVKTKFDRYESSSSESSEESEDEGLAASGDEASVLVLAPDEEDSLDKLINELEKEEQSATPNKIVSSNVPDAEVDIDSDPKPVTFEVEIADSVKVDSPVSNDSEALIDIKKSPEMISVSNSVEVPLPVRPHSPSPQHVMPVNRVAPYSHRSPGYVGRSRSKSPLPYSSRPHAERSRSRSRSCQRVARSRSPRRYAPRRSVSPLRRAVSPHYLSPRRRSPVGGRMSPVDWFSPRRRSSPRDRSSPGRRRFPSPRGRGSPSRLSPRRYGSPSPPRRHFSPNNRLSPRRWVSPRRRKSPSPVKRNPSPPRRFSPLRRSPLGRRVSPLRRNPSPPRKLYPLSQQGRQHSPRRYPPSPPRGSSPRRYSNQLLRRMSPSRIGHHPGSQTAGDLSPWTPPLGNVRPVSPRFNRRKSISPRPRIRRGSVSPPFVKSERKSISPRPRKRRDSHSPYAMHRSDSISPKFSGKRMSMSPRRNNRRGSTSPRPDIRRRKEMSPRFGRRDSTSPNFVGGQRKSNSPRTVVRRGAVSPQRLVAKRKSSTSPKRRAGSSKRSRSQNKSAGLEHRHSSPSSKFRGADDHVPRTTLRAVRDKSRSLSLSPPPDEVKKKSPLRVKTHRHERTNAKKKGKSKKSRDKSVTKVPAEKTDESTILEARRRKFENVDVIKPVNKRIRLKTAGEELSRTPPKEAGELSRVTSDEIVATGDRLGEEVENVDDSLILDSPGDLWSDEESDCDNEGRFKSSTQNGNVACNKVMSFNDLLNPTAKPIVKGIRDRIGTRRCRSPTRKRKQRRLRAIKERLTLPPARERVEEIPVLGATRTFRGTAVEDVVEDSAAPLDIPSSPARLPALPVDKTKVEEESKMSEDGEIPPDPSERLAGPNQTESHADLRATLSLKRAARSAVLFPFKTGDKGSAPGTRLVQSAILEVMGKKHLKQLRKASLKAEPTVSTGENTDSHRVTVVNRTRATLKELMSGSVTLSADESTLTGDPSFTVGDLREGNARNRSIRLRLGLMNAAEEKTTSRKVKKLNRNNPAVDQV